MLRFIYQKNKHLLDLSEDVRNLHYNIRLQRQKKKLN